MSIKVEIARLGVKMIFHSQYKLKFTYTDFDKNRKEPFFLISNHASLHDPLYVAMNIKKYPYPVTSNILYTNKLMKFGLNKIIKSIPKRKGQSDIQTIRHILNAFNKDKNSIMIFPEGNSSFFGEQTPTDYMSTAKIVKKISHDLVVAKINGGYFARPRWGNRRGRPEFHVHYYVLLTKDQIDQMDLNTLSKTIETALLYNDYEWNKEQKITYRYSKKAVGLEQYIYVCPKCKSIQTLHTHKNDIYCDKCGHLAHINKYHLLEGLSFDNLIEWNQIQKKVLKSQKSNRVYESNGKLYQIELNKGGRRKIGQVKAYLDDKQLLLSNKHIQKPFDIDKINGLVLTQKNILSFDYDENTYMIKIKDPMLFLDRINLHKGDI
jgi:1-acyl-sn-glycerol-3-phosphate acyltransferase